MRMEHSMHASTYAALHAANSAEMFYVKRIRRRRSPVYSTKGMVACSQPLAAQAGLRILQAGGNAADAAVAVAAALSVTEPCCTGAPADSSSNCSCSCRGMTCQLPLCWALPARYSKHHLQSPWSPAGHSVPGTARSQRLQQAAVCRHHVRCTFWLQ
jgi:hypothetical protein